MYYFFLDKLPLPVAPAALTVKTGNKNTTVSLINGEDINIIRNSGLQEITFEFMVPHKRYPFVQFDSGLLLSTVDSINQANQFAGNGTTLDLGGADIPNYVERLKADKKPFQFIVARMNGMQMLFSTNIKVTLEDSAIREDAEELGLDKMISVTLKQYKPYSTKILEVDKDGKAIAKRTRG